MFEKGLLVAFLSEMTNINILTAIKISNKCREKKQRNLIRNKIWRKKDEKHTDSKSHIVGSANH